MLESEKAKGVGGIEGSLVENVERESKFLVSSLEDVPFSEADGVKINQGYLYIGENGDELRVRQKGEKYYLTRKSGSGLVRSEEEEEIDAGEFEILYQQTEGLRVEKTRHVVDYGDFQIEVDVFEGGLDGLITAEVEFDDEAKALGFVAPEWLGEDVTESGKYSNQRLAQLSRELDSIDTDIGFETVKRDNEPYRFGLSEGMNLLVEKTENDLQLGQVVIAVAGGSASGKTSEVAEKLVKAYQGRAVMLSMDDYSRGSEYVRQLKEQGVEINYDMPNYIDIDLMVRHLALLKKGMSVWVPVFDFLTGEPSERKRLIKPVDLIVVEGLFALDERIAKQSSANVFVDISTHGRAMRRFFRDVKRTKMIPNDIIRYFAEVVEPMHDRYVAVGMKNADVIIENEYDPQVESSNAGHRELQLKFESSLSEESIISAGGVKVDEYEQVDSYYEPFGSISRGRGESLRIRRQGDRVMFTYKGPRRDSEVRKRDRFDAEIDNQTAEIFVRKYDKCVMELLKKRKVFSLGSISIAIDQGLIRMTGDRAEFLPDHVEICLDSEEVSESDRMLLEGLGLDMSQAVIESYQDLLRGTVEL